MTQNHLEIGTTANSGFYHASLSVHMTSSKLLEPKSKVIPPKFYMMRKILCYRFLTNFKSFRLVVEQLLAKEFETWIALYGIEAVLVC